MSGPSERIARLPFMTQSGNRQRRQSNAPLNPRDPKKAISECYQSWSLRSAGLAMIASIHQIMSSRNQQIQFCTSRDGTSIAYATCGAGPPLVWVQHWMHHLEFDLDNIIWRPWLEFLARHHTLVRFDWRGCGLSDRNDIDFAFENIIEDLEA